MCNLKEQLECVWLLGDKEINFVQELSQGVRMYTYSAMEIVHDIVYQNHLTTCTQVRLL